jgi:hypothetical protein
MSGRRARPAASTAKSLSVGVKEDDDGGAGFPIRWFQQRRARGRREHWKEKEWGVKR